MSLLIRSNGLVDQIFCQCALGNAVRSCPFGGVKGFGCRFPRRLASLKEGTYVCVEEDTACAAVAGRE